MRILAVGAVLACCGCAHQPTGPLALDFEGERAGEVPAGWRVEAAAMPPKLATWGVVSGSDGTAFALTSPNHEDRRTFNIAWNPSIRFQDGSIRVRARADSGKVDQGGGIIWRARDAENYYLARYNPLETNLRVYHVKDAVRTQLGDAPDIHIPTGAWWTLEVRQRGDHIVVALDGKDLLDVRDATFSGPGGVGLWTKADAATTFDDLEVIPE